MKPTALLLIVPALIAADLPPPLPPVRTTGVIETNRVCPPCIFVFTNLTGKTGLQESTNNIHWRTIITWPSNEYDSCTIETDPTNRCVYWRLIP